MTIDLDMPTSLEKRANFRRLAQKRTDYVLEGLRKLANLSSANYEFEEHEIEKIFGAIEKGVAEAKGRFGRNLAKRDPFKL